MGLGVLKVSPGEFAEKGEEIYSRIGKELEERYWGKYAAIEVESGEYFIGDRVVEAVRKAREKYPQRIFYVKRIGFKTLHTFR